MRGRKGGRKGGRKRGRKISDCPAVT